MVPVDCGGLSSRFEVGGNEGVDDVPSKDESLLDEGSKKERGVEVEEGGQEDSISQIFWLLFTTKWVSYPKMLEHSEEKKE
jgi:hypothetical protein